MAQNLDWKVYHRVRGETKKTMIAKFREQVDAINYAYDQSGGKYNQNGISILILSPQGRVVMRFSEGIKR